MRPYRKAFVNKEPDPTLAPIIECSYVAVDTRLMLDPPPWKDVEVSSEWVANGLKFISRTTFGMALGDHNALVRKGLLITIEAPTPQHSLALGGGPSPYRIELPQDDYVQWILLRAILGCPMKNNVPKWARSME
jgi:hypothetical protein